jgi:hypothetical protein
VLLICTEKLSPEIINSFLPSILSSILYLIGKKEFNFSYIEKYNF